MDNQKTQSLRAPSLLVASMRPFDGRSNVWPTLLEAHRLRRCSVSVILGDHEGFEELEKGFPGVVCVPRGFGGFETDFPELIAEELSVMTELMGHQDFPVLRTRVLRSFNRHDTTGAFRLIDREVLFDELFLGLGGTILRQRITHVYFDVTPHVASEYITFWLAKALGLRVIFLQPIPVAGLSIVRDDIDTTRTMRSKIAGPSFAAEPNAYMRLQLDQFVSQAARGRAPWVERYLGPELKKLERNNFQLIKKFCRFFGLAKGSNSAGIPGIRVLPEPIFSLIQSILAWGHRKTFLLSREKNSSVFLPETPFLLYALTHEPERTFFPEALPWESQFELISALAASQAGKRVIVVKEHETQYAPGRLGYSSRSVNFYRAVEKLPNVRLVSSRVDAKKILAEAEGVASATGTICVESAISGKPAYYFGNPWWEGFPGTVKVSRKNMVDGKLPSCGSFSAQSCEAWVNGLLAKSILSTSNVSNEIFSTKFAELPSGYGGLEVDALRNLIESFLFYGADSLTGDN